MFKDVDALSSAVTKATKSYIRSVFKNKFVKSELAIFAIQNLDGIEPELDMYRTTIHNAILRVVRAHNSSVASEKKRISELKNTMGNMFPQLEGLK